jgi:hypothetical protein
VSCMIVRPCAGAVDSTRGAFFSLSSRNLLPGARGTKAGSGMVVPQDSWLSGSIAMQWRIYHFSFTTLVAYGYVKIKQ